ncbi:unnamed protein product [Sympodiomycopsis kandeliae]
MSALADNLKAGPSSSSSSSSSKLPTGSIYSQPPPTGAGQHANTILVSALDALKTHKSPIRLEDFALTYGLHALIEDDNLKERLKNHPRVEWNSKLDLFTYKPEHDLRSPRDLINLLQERYKSNTSRCGGMKLSELRESYPNAKEAIEEFANVQPKEDREVLVMRGKDGAAKMVFWNQLQGQEAKGPDEEFKDLWHQIKVPDAVDLARSLESDGLTSANLISSTSTNSGHGAGNRGGKRGGRGGKRGGGAGSGGNSRSKLQNTHLKDVDLTKDYVGD